MIAHYVHDERDDVLATRTYVWVTDVPLKVYDENTDNFKLVEPRPDGVPYCILTTSRYKTRAVVEVINGQVKEVDQYVTKFLGSTSRIVDEEEFERLRNNGITMQVGVHVNTQTNQVIGNQ